MTVLAVIPARYASTRFPGKPLTLIAGRPMICHVWDRVAATTGIDAAVVATEDERIVQVCREHGMDVEMTADTHETGTDRLAEVAQRRMADVYVNVQGDEPLIEPTSIDALLARHREVASVGTEVVTGYVVGATPEQEASLSVVHVTNTVDGHVLSFSRLPVPAAFRSEPVRNVQLGLYSFTRGALARFQAWEQGPNEQAESVELLRFLEHGERVGAAALPSGSIAVDHPEDVARVEARLRGD